MRVMFDVTLKRSTGRSRCCPCVPASPSDAATNYQRHGTLSLFAALDVTTGKVIGRCYQRHRSREFRKFRVPSTPRCRAISTCIW